jgi:hypothetical protein
LLCFFCRQLEVEVSPDRQKSLKRKTMRNDRADSGNAIANPFGFLFSSTSNTQPAEQEMVSIGNPMLLNRSSDLTFVKIDPGNPPSGN